MSEMALTADHLIVVGRGRLLADTSMAGFIAESGSDSLEEAFLQLTAGAVEYQGRGDR
jgi:ABC-2 type transport system ATP-binding protein